MLWFRSGVLLGKRLSHSKCFYWYGEFDHFALEAHLLKGKKLSFLLVNFLSSPRIIGLLRLHKISSSTKLMMLLLDLNNELLRFHKISSLTKPMMLLLGLKPGSHYYVA